jgi:hypothetical protein
VRVQVREKIQLRHHPERLQLLDSLDERNTESAYHVLSRERAGAEIDDVTFESFMTKEISAAESLFPPSKVSAHASRGSGRNPQSKPAIIVCMLLTIVIGIGLLLESRNPTMGSSTSAATATAAPIEKQVDVAAYVLSVLPPLDACEKECILSSTSTTGFSSSDFSDCVDMLRAAPQGTCEAQLPKSAKMFAGLWKTRAAVASIAKTFPREAPDTVLIGMAAYCDKSVANAEAQMAHLTCSRQWNSGGCTTDRMNELNRIAMSLKFESEAMLRDLHGQAVPRTGAPADRAAATRTLDKIDAAFSKCMKERVQPIFNGAAPQVRVIEGGP